MSDIRKNNSNSLNFSVTLERKETSQSPNSPRRTKKDFFLTSQPSKEFAYTKVMEVHSELNSLIDKMDIKIEDVINRHESEFLFAYRNHTKKIRLELEQIKNKAANAESHSNNYDRIASLEKQLVLFREEALKLYDKLEERNRECDEYKLKLAEADSQNKFLQTQVKKLMKRTKYLEGTSTRNNLENQNKFENAQTLVREPITTKIVNKIQFRKSRTISKQTTTENTVILTPLERLRSLMTDRDTLLKVNDIINQLMLDKDRKYAILNKRFEDLVKRCASNVSADLEKFFLTCVETVRKDVCRRQNLRTTNHYQFEYINYEDFKKLDHIKILQLLVSNDEALNLVYESIFRKEKKMHKTTLDKKYNSFIV